MTRFFDCARRIGIEASLPVRKAVYKASKGKLSRSLFLQVAENRSVGTDVRIVKSQEDAVYIAKFNADGSFSDRDFVILATTDLHLEGNTPEQNRKALDLVCRQISEVKPDLVVFTGDIVQTDHQHMDAAQFAEMMEMLGVYWVYVFGNHEARDEKEYYKYLIFKSICDYPHCLSKFSDPSLFGFGNFIVNIMNSETELKQSLVFFDSGRDMVDEHRKIDGVPADLPEGYDYIKKSQIAWYEKEIKSLKETYGKVESMLYMHIPIKEYEEVFYRNEEGKFVPTGKAEILYGRMFESVGSSPYNSGLFDAMKRNGSQAIFCGHDHVNDWAAKYEGIYLVYNQYGSYGAYNLGDYNGMHLDEKDWQQGVTITTVHQDGSIDLRQSLNAKYLK